MGEALSCLLRCSHVRLGTYCSDTSLGRRWSSTERDHHINVLAREMKVAFLVLKSLAYNQRGCHILLLLNNVTAI